MDPRSLKKLIPLSFVIIFIIAHSPAQAVNPQIVAGGYFTVGLKQNETVVAVGDNSQGQLNVNSWSEIVQVAAGWYHTIGLKTNGTVVSAGMNDHGQLNVGGWSNIVEVSAGALHTLGLKSDGKVLATGENGAGQLNVSGWSDVIQVSAARYHTVGLKSDGTVLAVGSNSYGQLNVNGWSNIVQVAAGAHHTVGLKSDGTVLAAGSNSYGQSNVNGWSNIVQIAVKNLETIGLKSDGSVVAVGDNYSNQLDVGGWTNIAKITVGYQHTIGLKSDNTLIATGSNYQGQLNLGNWKDIVQLASGSFYHTIGLKTDYTVVGVGSDSVAQAGLYDLLDVKEWHDIIQVTAGYGHSVGLKLDGTVIAAGSNDKNQLNVNNWLSIVQVSAGWYHTVGLKSDGSVIAVGQNTYGQLNTTNWSNIIQISAGQIHTVGLKNDGTVMATGSNSSNQLNVSNWSGIIQASAGGSHTVGLQSNGTVVAVGSNSKGQVNTGSWSNIIQVATGINHTIGLNSDGSVVAVGDNSSGQLNVSDWSDIVQVAAGGFHTLGIKSDGRIVAAGDNYYGQCSFFDDLFDLQQQSLLIISPNGSDVLTKGIEHTIKWNSTSIIGNVQIDLYRGGSAPEFFVRQLAAAAPNTGSYPFSPPIYLAAGNDYLIGISAEDGTIFDFSDSYFSIQSEYDYLPDSFAFLTINSPQSVDTPFAVTITAKKADGTVLTGYNGTVILYSNLSAVNPTIVKLENGQKTFTVTLDTPGSVQLTCGSNGIFGQSNVFTVLAVNPCSGSITGKVIDNNGDPVFSASVFAFDSQGNQIATSYTDTNGTYGFTGLNCNQYELRIDKNGITKTIPKIDVAGDLANKINNLELPLNSRTRGTPVILIPGILGSSSGAKNWPIPKLSSQKPDLQLHIHDPLGHTGFTEIKEFLEDNGFNVFNCPWDWRLTAAEASLAYVIPKIDEALQVSTTGKVHVVAHSMGGLVVRAYVQGSEYRGDINKFAMIGTPNLGSCNPYYIWEGGDPQLIDDILDSGLFSGINIYTNTIQSLWEDTYNKKEEWSRTDNTKRRKFVRDVAPSLLELMNVKHDFLFDANNNTWGTATSGNVNTWLKSLNIDTNIQNLMSNDGSNGTKVHVAVFAGKDEKSTIQQIKCGPAKNLYEDGALALPEKKTMKWGTGDGTVTYESSTWPFSQGWAELVGELSGEHSKLIDVFREDIFNFLSSANQLKIYRINLSELLNNTSSSNLVISVNGAVRACVTDASGNKSGVDPATGDIVEQIAGSETYFRFNGGEVGIKNPTQGSYSVTIFGDQGKDYQLEVGYITPEKNEIIRLKGFKGAIPTSFQLVLSPNGQPAVSIVPSVNSPTSMVAEPYSSNGTELTRLRWTQSSTPGVVNYNLYSAADFEPHFEKIASVPAGQSAYDATNPWSYDPSATLRVYAITAVTDTGAESFFSEVVQNNDRDNDKLSDWDEAALGTNLTSPDTDGDGLTDGEEVRIGTNPLMADSDNDGFSDAEELTKGSNPLDPNSVPTFTGDMDYDCDVDGKDLALLISEFQTLVDEQKLSTFAASFGRTDCP